MLHQILDDISVSVKEKILKKNLGENYKHYHALQNLIKNSGIFENRPFTPGKGQKILK